MNTGNHPDLRAVLRAETSDSHEKLDQLMSGIGWSTAECYARFLEIQYAARKPIESWLAQNFGQANLPPEQSALIASDLAGLGARAPAAATKFVPSGQTNLLGAAWAIAGSSLGNAVILCQIDETGSTDWPRSFLADQAMKNFWKAIRPQLNSVPTADEAAAAVTSAKAVFDHFISVATSHRETMVA